MVSPETIGYYSEAPGSQRYSFSGDARLPGHAKHHRLRSEHRRSRATAPGHRRFPGRDDPSTGITRPRVSRVWAPNTLDYDALARVTLGMQAVIAAVAR